jgi:antitoxin component of RelBE/YafQ-DinJ toxin-antitoxin module
VAKTATINARIEADVQQQFYLVAKAQGVSVSALLEEACRNTIMAFNTQSALESLERQHAETITALQALGKWQREQAQ